MNLDLTSFRKAVNSLSLDEYKINTTDFIRDSSIKRYSDLDLALEHINGQPIAFSILALISTDFEYSNLPYRADLVDSSNLTPILKKNVDALKQELKF